jgi:hypothetical protein
MAHPKARLYQRLRSKRFPWVLVEFHKNGSPKTHSDAFQFGVRYSLDGKRKLDTAATLDEALVILKDRNVRLYAQQNGIALPEAAAKRSDSRTVIVDAIAEYLTTGKAYEKKWSEDTLRCYRDSTGLLLRYCLAEGVEYIQDIDKKVVLRFKPFLRESKDRLTYLLARKIIAHWRSNWMSISNLTQTAQSASGPEPFETVPSERLSNRRALPTSHNHSPNSLLERKGLSDSQQCLGACNLQTRIAAPSKSCSSLDKSSSRNVGTA